MFLKNLQSINLFVAGLIIFVNRVCPGEETCKPVAQLERSSAHSELSRIPKDLFQYEAINLLQFPDKGPIQGCVLKTLDRQCVSMLFEWNNICSDGVYRLTVTPEQVVLYSAHYNPNGSYVYWFTDINEYQYLKVLEALHRQKSPRLTSCSDYSCDFDRVAKEQAKDGGTMYSCNNWRPVLAANMAELFKQLSLDASGVPPPKAKDLGKLVWIKEAGVIHRKAKWCE